MEPSYDDQSEASFTTAMATPSKPHAQPFENTWDAETSPVIMEDLEDKENSSANTQHTHHSLINLNWQSPTPKTPVTPSSAFHDEDSNNAEEESGPYGRGEPSISPPGLSVDRTLSMDEPVHQQETAETSCGDGCSESGGNTFAAFLGANELSPAPSDESVGGGNDTNIIMNETVAPEEHSEIETCQAEPSNSGQVEENNIQVFSPASIETPPAESVTHNDDVSVFQNIVPQVPAPSMDEVSAPAFVETPVESATESDGVPVFKYIVPEAPAPSMDEVSTPASVETRPVESVLHNDDGTVFQNIVPQVPATSMDEVSPRASVETPPVESAPESDGVPVFENIVPEKPAPSMNEVSELNVQCDGETIDETKKEEIVENTNAGGANGGHGDDDDDDLSAVLSSLQLTRFNFTIDDLKHAGMDDSTPVERREQMDTSVSAFAASEEVKEESFLTEITAVKEEAELCADSVNSTEHSVEPPPPSVSVKGELLVEECVPIFSPSVTAPSSISASSTADKGSGNKKKKKKSKKSTRKKRASESTTKPSNGNSIMDGNTDFAATYKLEPTIPRGPKLRVDQLPSQKNVVEEVKKKKPAEDFAATYKLEATIPRGPELNAERRCTMAATRRAIQGKSPPPPPEPKVAIDYAKSYKMVPTVPKSPQFSQKYAQSQQKNIDIDNSKNKGTKQQAPDYALTYKLEPTIPKDLPIQHHPRRPSKEPAQADVVPEKERIDYIKCYNGEPTKPNSPQLSFMVKKTKAKSPKPATSKKTSSGSTASTSGAQFKARPLPSYIRRTSSGISPNRTSQSNVSPPAARTQFKARPLPSYIRRTTSGITPRSPSLATSTDKNKPTFKARAMPNFDRVAIPPRGTHTVSTTSSSPGNSNSGSGGKAPYIPLSIALHEQAVAAWNAKMEAENRALEERRNFKARPLSADMLEGACFVPVLGQFSPTRPIDVVTYSRDRAYERHLYDTRNAERVSELERAQLMAEEARRLDELAKTKERLEKNAFKARPVPQSLYADPLSVPLPSKSPRTPKNKIKRKKRRSTSESTTPASLDNRENQAHDAEYQQEEEPASPFSPGEMLANMRKAFGKLSPV